eukprot:m.111621 g.111621  ORF g.111621 m.111621 type:complete len:242 (+) comp51827_c1_seq4:511-1236(+)
MSTYYGAVQNSAKDRAEGKVSDLDLSGFFASTVEDVCILDEFDSLIMEHNQVCNTVYRYESVVPITGLGSAPLSNHHDFFTALNRAGNSELDGDYISTLLEFGMDAPVQKLLTDPDSNKAGRTEHNSLGQEVSYIGGIMHEIKRGHFYARAVKLSTLAHLRTFKHVIGLSGSITAEEIAQFQSVFSQEVCYIDIPPFYGLTKANNRLIASKRGSPEGIHDLPTWAAALKADIQVSLLQVIS